MKLKQSSNKIKIIVKVYDRDFVFYTLSSKITPLNMIHIFTKLNLSV